MRVKLTKWQIACLIESLPGNYPWCAASLMTTIYDSFTRSELVAKYNSLIDSRHIDRPHIS